MRAWCGRHSVRETSFQWWRRQLPRRDAEAITLAAVRVTADSPAVDAQHEAPSGIEIVWPGQRVVRVVGRVDRGALTDVLAVLASLNSAAAEASAC